RILSSLFELGRAESADAGQGADKAAKVAVDHATSALVLAQHVPDVIEAMITLGRAYHASHECEKAIEHFQKALRLSKDTDDAKADPSITTAVCYLYLARTYAKLDQ